MTETELYGQILRAHSNGSTRLFRQQSGQFWTGQVVVHERDRLVLAHPRIVRVGVPGMSDLGGVTSIVITPDMVGQRIGVHVQVEGKSATGRLTPQQSGYLAIMRSLGARVGVARSVDDVTAILLGELVP